LSEDSTAVVIAQVEMDGYTLHSFCNNNSTGASSEVADMKIFFKDQGRVLSPHVYYLPRFSIGTRVRKRFDQGWYFGTIIEITSYHYSVLYEDGDDEQFELLEHDTVIALLVDNAIADISQKLNSSTSSTTPESLHQGQEAWSVGSIFPVGTRIRKKSHKTSFVIVAKLESDHYIVQEEGQAKSNQMISFQDQHCLLAPLVSYIPPFSIGTRVRKEFDSGWYFGTITNITPQHYCVLYDDGDDEQFQLQVHDSELSILVENALQVVKAKASEGQMNKATRRKKRKDFYSTSATAKQRPPTQNVKPPPSSSLLPTSTTHVQKKAKTTRN